MCNVALVFHMHKTGSSTVMQAMREIGRLPERGSEDNFDYLKPLAYYEKVVTPVRDPVARNISYLFEMHSERIVEIDSLEEIYGILFSGLISHNDPLCWFDEVYKEAFGINVYSRKFAKKRGWSIINKRYLFIQTEKLTGRLPEAFQELFGERPSPIYRAKTKDTRDYGELYAKFVDFVKFSKEYLDKMYNSKYVNHFYSKEQIEKMRARWAE